MNKLELREMLKTMRLEMSDAERTLKSREIVRHLQETVDWTGVKTVHYFEPLHELMEVDISDLVVWLEDNYPGIQLFAPRLIEGEWEMISIKDAPAPDQFDVIIVPMLGFDSKLHRIGYGGGYYDKFLASQPKAKKIGVCFEAGKVEHIPAESHDVSVDLLITEQRVYTK
ncbi:5-formyltetrahydrofolate cyclo-ligase [Candidatus Saccharibacteria bacterium CG_4_10_14_0_2_um_filter_52_9]|nr:MAG: 5-formyltetrahydrofolate cyclo-ligase [Candidatus Saccharibacteria bacterium CG_4_10_14_0_2_um_filter_52_9]